MAVLETQVAALEAERLQPKLRVLFESEGPFYQTIKKRNVEKVSYREMRVPMKVRPGGSFQYFNPNGGDLGRGGGPTYDKAVVSCVFMAEAIEFTKLTKISTDDTRKAIVNAVRDITSSAFDEIQRQIDSQLMQAGNGVVGTISAVSTASGVDTYTLASDGFGARLVRFGQTVQVYDTTLATLRGETTITFHDVENKVIKGASVASTVATDKLVVKGISSPATLPALLGVPYHHSNASTGTWLGYNRANYPEIRSNGVNANSVALSLTFPRLARYKIGNRIGDLKKGVTAWMHPCQAAAYEDLGIQVSMIQKTSGNDKLNLYFGDNMQLAGAPVRTSNNWDKTRIDFISEEFWGRGEILPLGYYTSEDGRKFFELRGPTGGVMTSDVFYLVVGMQSYVDQPGGTAYIYSLAVPSGY